MMHAFLIWVLTYGISMSLFSYAIRLEFQAMLKQEPKLTAFFFVFASALIGCASAWAACDLFVIA
jgi:hypothetical protein